MLWTDRSGDPAGETAVRRSLTDEVSIIVREILTDRAVMIMLPDGQKCYKIGFSGVGSLSCSIEEKTEGKCDEKKHKTITEFLADTGADTGDDAGYEPVCAGGSRALRGGN